MPPSAVRDGDASSAGPKKTPASNKSKKQPAHIKCKAESVLVEDDEAARRVVVSKPGTTCVCAVCGRSSQDVDWAAITETTRRGETVKQAVGNGCSECYVIGVDVLGHANFQDFAAAHRKASETSLRSRVQSIRDRMSTLQKAKDEGATPTPLAGSKRVASEMSFNMKIKKRFRCYNEYQLKKKLSCTRLTKEAVKGVPVLRGPSIIKPSEDDTYYLFEVPSGDGLLDDGFDMELEMEKAIKLDDTTLQPEKCLYESHGDDFAHRSVCSDSFHKCLKEAVCHKSLQTLDQFMEAYDGHKRRHQTKATGAQVTPDKKSGITGKAAGEYVLVQEGESKPDDYEADLTDNLVKASHQMSPAFGRKKSKASLGDDLDSDSEGDGNEGECHSGDWVGHWRARLSLRSCMIKESKGRTERSLRERVNELIKEPSTRQQGVLLQRYHTKVRRAMAWRCTTHVENLDDAQLEEDLRHFTSESVLLPAAQCGALISRRAKKASNLRQWADVFDAVMPFTRSQEETFNPALPRMRTLPRVLQFRIEAFNTILFDDLVSPLLFEDKSALPTVQQIMDVLQQSLEKEDLLAMDANSSVCFNELTTISHGMGAICRVPFSSENEEAVRELCAEPMPRKNPYDSSCLEKVQTILCSDCFFGRRAKEWLSNMPLITLHEEKLHQHLQRLQDAKVRLQVSDLISSHECFADTVLKCNGEVSFGSFSDLLLNATLKVAGELQWEAKSGQQSEEWWALTYKLMSKATNSFPLDVNLPNMHMALANLQAKWAGLAQHESVRASLMAIKDRQEALTQDEALEVSKVCSSIAGTGGDEGFKDSELLCSLSAKMLAHIFKQTFDKTSKEFCAATAQVISLMPQKFSEAWRPVQEWTMQCHGLAVLLELTNETGSFPVKDIKKALEEVKAALSASDKFEHSAILEQHSVLADFKAAATDLWTTFESKVTEVMDSKVQASVQALRAAIDATAASAYGTSTGTAWSASLKAKSTPEQIVEAANADEGLLATNIEQLTSNHKALEAAMQQCQEDHEMAGSIIERELMERASMIHCRAILTCCEYELISIMSSKEEVDKQEVRGKVQAAIIRLRHNKKYQEKELLPVALYKWAYLQLTSRG